MPPPSPKTSFGFGDYLRVMRQLDRFWFGAVLLATSLVASVARGKPQQTLVGVGIGVALLLAYFPIWRWLARKHPDLATEWQPDLLSNPPPQDRLMQPSEPGSNVHLVTEEDRG